MIQFDETIFPMGWNYLYIPYLLFLFFIIFPSWKPKEASRRSVSTVIIVMKHVNYRYLQTCSHPILIPFVFTFLSFPIRAFPRRARKVSLQVLRTLKRSNLKWCQAGPNKNGDIYLDDLPLSILSLFLGLFLLRILGKGSNLIQFGQPSTIVSDCRYSAFAAFPLSDSILFIARYLRLDFDGLRITTHPGKKLKTTETPPKLHTPNVADPFEGLRQVDGLIAMEESVQLGVRLFLRCPHGKVETSRRVESNRNCWRGAFVEVEDGWKVYTTQRLNKIQSMAFWCSKLYAPIKHGIVSMVHHYFTICKKKLNAMRLQITHPKTNMAPEDRTLEKEMCIGNHYF